MNPYPVRRLGGPMAGTGSGLSPPRPLRRALFVDRDGTLNPDLHYLGDAGRLELFRGVGNALSLARDHGFLVVCVTNQSGIERGFYTAADVDRIHERLNRLLQPYRAHVDAFYFCPHSPETHCECRKPGTLLFERARDELRIDMAGSAIIGDRYLDVAAGRALGLLTAVVAPPGHTEDEEYRQLEESGSVDVSAGSFLSAVLRILACG